MHSICSGINDATAFTRSVVSYKVTELPIFNQDQIAKVDNISLYDSIDDEVLRSYNEFALTSLIFFAMKEGACSEQSSRMTAMGAATKNAGQCMSVTIVWCVSVTIVWCVSVTIVRCVIVTIVR